MNRLRFQRSQLCIPYGLFLVCFVFAPLVVIIYYAFTDGEGRLTLANLTSFFPVPTPSGHLHTAWDCRGDDLLLPAPGLSDCIYTGKKQV